MPARAWDGRIGPRRAVRRHEAGGLSVSLHALRRVQQRGYRASDLELVMEFGTTTAEGIVLQRREVEALRSSAMRVLARLERLAGTAVVVREDTVVTLYRATRAQRRRMVRVAA